MNVRKAIISLSALLTVGWACAADNFQTKSVTVGGGITKVEVAHGITLIYTPSTSTTLNITAHSAELDRVIVRTEGKTLKLQMKPMPDGNNFNNGAMSVKAELSAPVIGNYDASSGASISIPVPLNAGKRSIEIETSSGASFSANGIRCGSLEAEASSGSSIGINHLRATSVEAEVSSGASMSLSGKCEDVQLEASSGASLDASGLEAEEGTLKATSAASLSANVESPGKITKNSGGSVTNR